MPFFIGYFGKSSPEYFDRLKHIAEENAIDKSMISISNNNLHVFAGIYKNEIQPDCLIPVGNQQGLLTGKIFRTHNYQTVKLFEQQEATIIIKNLHNLTKNYWGRYSGILYDEIEQQISLVRDPLGLNTLFYKQTTDGILFTSELALLHDILEEKPSLNYHYFAEYAINQNYVLPSTPLLGIQELLPGIALTFQNATSIHQKHLWDFPKASFISNMDEFEQELLATLKGCVKAWVGENKKICVELSGGLDSSALMILLRDCLPEESSLIGVNRIDSKESSSNEIEYANEVANACRASLYFHDSQEGSLFDPLPLSWRPDHPTTFLLMNKMNEQLSNLAQTNGCSVIINGQGGDHIFLANPSSQMLADYWIENGWKGIHNPLRELSLMNRTSWWSIIQKASKETYNYYRGQTEGSTDLNQITYLHPSFKKGFKLQHFYLEEKIAEFGPARQDQIKGLYHAILYADRNRKIPGTIITHPLLSQPVVELALKIPAYQSFKDGYNRVVFRKTVNRVQSSKTLWRSLKGHTTNSALNELIKQSDTIADLLFHGTLVKSEIFDKQWIQQKLIKIRHGQIDNLWPLIHMISAQIWCNQWQK